MNRTGPLRRDAWTDLDGAGLGADAEGSEI